MASFIYYILDKLLDLLCLVIIVSAVMSWLFAFDVVNRRNAVARGLDDFLQAVTNPILKPLRKVIPSLGGVDLTPLIALIVIQAIQRALLPEIFGWLAQYIG